MRENEWRHWAEGQNAALRDAIKSAGKRGHSSGGGLGAAAGLSVVVFLLGLVFVLALPIIYPSFLVGRLVANAVHPLPGILVGVGLFAACVAALYFSRLARSFYAFAFAFAAQLLAFIATTSSSDVVWAGGASVLIGVLGYRAAFAVTRLRGEEDRPRLRAWLVSVALAAASLAPNFVAVAFYGQQLGLSSAPSSAPSTPPAVRNNETHWSPRPAPETSNDTVSTAQMSGSTAGMILPGSERHLLTSSDIANLSPQQLRIARNEIFARHGLVFIDPALREHFRQFDWYTPTTNAVRLNDVENANVRFLQQAEESQLASASQGAAAQAGYVQENTFSGITNVYGLVVRQATPQELAQVSSSRSYGLVILSVEPDSLWRGSRAEDAAPQAGDIVLSGIGGGMWTDPAEFQRYANRGRGSEALRRSGQSTFRVCVDARRIAAPGRVASFCADVPS